jgi:signal transduction histidine kinase
LPSTPLLTPHTAPPQPLRAEIQRNISELDQLIDEILLASRLDAREADMGTVELIDLVGLSAEESARVGAELELHAEAEQLQVPGVAKLLRRLVRNLLENARRYGKQQRSSPDAPPDITLSLEREDGQVVLRVLDRGPGVPPEQRERIFEPFYRLPGVSERDGSVGLGLALVKSITVRHGGHVHCEARAGGGACFVVRLPARSASTLG